METKPNYDTTIKPNPYLEVVEFEGRCPNCFSSNCVYGDVEFVCYTCGYRYNEDNYENDEDWG